MGRTTTPFLATHLVVPGEKGIKPIHLMVLKTQLGSQVFHTHKQATKESYQLKNSQVVFGFREKIKSGSGGIVFEAKGLCGISW